MKLSEYCESSPGYIGEIEMGRKFPSIEMIEKIAKVLKIEPYHLLKNWAEADGDSAFPLLPNNMKTEIKNRIYASVNEVFDQY